MNLKPNKKNIFYFVFGVILTSIIGVSATSLYLAGDVGYTPNDTSWKVDTIKEAIDELYNQDYSVRNSCKEQVSVPNLGSDDKLIPVTLSDNGTVTYADISKEWYNYCDKEWANAVILIDEPSKTYSVGETIEEEDIESYFVWIPKYKYKLWNTGVASKNRHSIEIIFDATNTKDEEGVSCATPMTSGNIGNCNNGEYMTHPAFISMDVEGFWVGKFETGYKGATSASGAQKNVNDKSFIIVKPDSYSWRYNTAHNIFVSSYEYERNLNSHMIKNTEWGALVYLSHSKYGIDMDININNNSDFKTGYSALPSTSQHTYPGTYGKTDAYNALYNTEVGFLASSTGNITGVYDLSGGCEEYTTGYISGKLSNSGFTAATIANYDAKYFDVYNSSSGETSYQYMILGDATGEMGPFKQHIDGDNGSSRNHGNWYGDMSDFLSSSNSWFYRSGYYAHGLIAGQYTFNNANGSYNVNTGSRLVLAP